MSIINYIKDTIRELKHVNWPTRKQVIYFTILVIIVSLVVSVFLGVFDVVFNSLLKYVLEYANN